METNKTAVQSAADTIEHELVVIESFPGYAKGEIITEAAKIKELIESEWQSHFVKRQK